VLVHATVSPPQAHLFIVNPFSGRNAAQAFGNLFSTHPPTPGSRVSRRLRGGIRA
jgi:hypothetical protein